MSSEMQRQFAKLIPLVIKKIETLSANPAVDKEKQLEIQRMIRQLRNLVERGNYLPAGSLLRQAAYLASTLQRGIDMNRFTVSLMQHNPELFPPDERLRALQEELTRLRQNYEAMLNHIRQLQWDIRELVQEQKLTLKEISQINIRVYTRMLVRAVMESGLYLDKEAAEKFVAGEIQKELNNIEKDARIGINMNSFGVRHLIEAGFYSNLDHFLEQNKPSPDASLRVGEKMTYTSAAMALRSGIESDRKELTGDQQSSVSYGALLGGSPEEAMHGTDPVSYGRHFIELDATQTDETVFYFGDSLTNGVFSGVDGDPASEKDPQNYGLDYSDIFSFEDAKTSKAISNIAGRLKPESPAGLVAAQDWVPETWMSRLNKPYIEAGMTHPVGLKNLKRLNFVIIEKKDFESLQELSKLPNFPNVAVRVIVQPGISSVDEGLQKLAAGFPNIEIIHSELNQPFRSEVRASDKTEVAHVTSFKNFESILKNGFYNGINYKTFLSLGMNYPTYGDSTAIQIIFKIPDDLIKKNPDTPGISVYMLNEKSALQTEAELNKAKEVLGQSFSARLKDGKGKIGHIPAEYIDIAQTNERNQQRVKDGSLSPEGFTNMKKLLDEFSQNRSETRSILDTGESAYKQMNPGDQEAITALAAALQIPMLSTERKDSQNKFYGSSRKRVGQF